MVGEGVLNYLIKKNQEKISKAQKKYEETGDTKHLEKIEKHKKIIKDLQKGLKRIKFE